MRLFLNIYCPAKSNCQSNKTLYPLTIKKYLSTNNKFRCTFTSEQQLCIKSTSNHFMPIVVSPHILVIYLSLHKSKYVQKNYISYLLQFYCRIVNNFHTKNVDSQTMKNDETYFSSLHEMVVNLCKCFVITLFCYNSIINKIICTCSNF